MVCNDTEGNVLLVVFLILAVCKSAHLVHQSAVCIDVEKGCHILADNSQSLKSHACIDIFLNQIGVISVSVIVKLGEYNVPYFHETIPFAAHNVLRTGTVLLSTVIVDLRARTTRTCAMLPEVVFFSETVDPLFRDTDLFVPDTESLIIVKVNGRIETVCRNSYAFCQELPGPMDRFCLKVIAEREVSQHLEECAVAGCLTDIFDITGTDTFLTGGDSASRRDLLSREVRL